MLPQSAKKIGFMQGRLSPMINNKIQCFPWGYWEKEFILGCELGFSLMEWTLDQERLYENPLMTSEGQSRILHLMKQCSFMVPSLTGDCFMQAPFYKQSGAVREALVTDLKNIIQACGVIGISSILIPLVDNGRIESKEQEVILKDELNLLLPVLKKNKQKIVFESDFQSQQLKQFMSSFDPAYFGINYDIGNSASLGFDPDEEFDCYGNWIVNVHVKDRLLGGTTVALGTGCADFQKVFRQLKRIGYQGNYILQTARSKTEQHTEDLVKYRDMVLKWI